MDNNILNLTQTPIQILLLDDDPIFSLGFRSILTSYPSLELLDFNTDDNIIQYIEKNHPQLIILEYNFLSYAKKILKKYPDIPLFLLTSQLEKISFSVIKSLGIKGYAPKNMPTSELINSLIKVALGESFWHQSIKQYRQKNPYQKLLSKLRETGLNEINNNLILLNNQLEIAQSSFDKMFLHGRKRELLTAKWLVNQLLPVEFLILENQPEQPLPLNNQLVLLSGNDALALSDNNIFQELKNIIQFDLINSSNYILEIDILTNKKKQELLQLIFENVFNKISKITPENSEKNLEKETLIYLKDIWQSVTISFFTNNYEQNIELTQYQIIELLKTEIPTNFQTILNYQNIFSQIIRYLVLKENIIIGNKIYNYESLEAQEILKIILETLIIMIANSTMELILNNFSQETVIQEKLIKTDLNSDREIARFRNSLSLRYFQKKYLEEPQQIFEGEYELFKIENGQIIRHKFKQINRKNELNELTGMRWFVTIMLELRDAMSPLVRSVFAKLGQSVIFILTKIIGQGIGLIGRGIFEGLGNSLPSNKSNKKNNNNF